MRMGINLSLFIRHKSNVLPQNGLRFVPKRNAFCAKTEGVLYQNARGATDYLFVHLLISALK